MCNVLLLTGPGGAGKSTIAKLIAERCDYVYLDGDREDTEFFPGEDDYQWAPENKELLRQAHQKILNKTKDLVKEGNNVVVDYIIFGHYLEFLQKFQKEFGNDLTIRVLMPKLEEIIKRDQERNIWTTGAERIKAVSEEFIAIKDQIGADNFIDTTGQTPEETFERYFAGIQKQ
jgi:adenylate kinase family enzyme